MNWFTTWFQSHKLSSHFTIGSIMGAFGTLFTLYTEVPQFQAWCQRLNSGLPGWLEGTVAMVGAVLLFYSKTSKPAQAYDASTGQTRVIPAGQTIVAPTLSGIINTAATPSALPAPTATIPPSITGAMYKAGASYIDTDPPATKTL